MMDSYLKRQLEHQKNTVEAAPISGGRIVLAIKTGEVTQAQAILDIIQTKALIEHLVSVANDRDATWTGPGEMPDDVRGWPDRSEPTD
jgi:hypothetical protein